MKTRILIFISIVIFSCLLLLESCKKHEQVNTPAFLQIDLPAGWPAPTNNNFVNNPPTEQGFQLGRKIFYDNRLSVDGSNSCASCHQRIAAFGTYDHDISHGIKGQHTLRSAPGLYNLAWKNEFDWDGRYSDIRSRAFAHIISSVDMGSDLQNVVMMMKADTAYPKLFIDAFGISAIPGRTITGERILKALEQFTGMLISSNSKYDKVKRGEAGFTTMEEEGYTIFKSRCGTCHAEPLFTDNSYRNTGLVVDNFLQDKGRMRVTGKNSDSLKFRVPSLRNVGFTFPYFHDGRRYTLERVIDHYSTGFENYPGTDPALLNKPPVTLAEKTRLVQFLLTLNDTGFITNPRFDAR